MNFVRSKRGAWSVRQITCIGKEEFYFSSIFEQIWVFLLISKIFSQTCIRKCLYKGTHARIVHLKLWFLSRFLFLLGTPSFTFMVYKQSVHTMYNLNSVERFEKKANYKSIYFYITILSIAQCIRNVRERIQD